MLRNNKKIRHKVALPNNLLIKQREDTLKDKWQLLVENASDGICILTGKNITYVNPTAYNLLGYAREEIINSSFKKFIAPEEVFRVMRMYMGYLAGKEPPKKFESVLMHKNGKKVYVELSVNKIKKDSIIIIRDITDRKNAEKALKESENIYKTIFENTGTATLIVEADMTISFANNQFIKMSGYSKEEIINKIKWPNFFAKEDIERMKKFHTSRRINPNAAPRNYEAKFINKKGDIKNLYLTVGLIPGTKKSVASLLDITKVKSAENELRSHKKLLDDIMHGSPIGTYVIDKNHKIVYWNRALEILTGIKASEVIGTSDHWKCFYKKKTRMMTDMLIDGDGLSKISNFKRYKDMDIEKCNDHKGIVCSKYFENFNGEKKWLRFMIKPLHDHKNNLIGAIETVDDITDRRLTRTALKNRMREFHVLYQINAHMRMIDPLTEVFNKVLKDLVLACDEVGPARSQIIFGGDVFTNLKKGEKFIKSIKQDITIFKHKRGQIELGYCKKIPNKESFSLKYEKKVLSIIADTMSRHIQHREVMKRYKRLVTESVVGIFILQDGCFQYVNPKFTKIFQLRSIDIIGKKCGDIISDCTWCSAGKDVHCTLRVQRGDGKNIDIELFTQITNYYGKEAILGTIQDVTKLKKAQERQKNFNKELKLKIEEKTKDLKIVNRRLQSLNELKDEFIAVTSHELRSPLTAARGYLSFLTDDQMFNDIPQEAKGYLMRIHDNVELLNNLINNILDVSRIEMGRFELQLKPIDIIDLIKQSIKSLMFQANEKNIIINLINNLDTKSFELQLDQVRMLQVIRNILDNAIKYSNKGKDITVGIKMRGIGIEIAIEDKGMGIRKSEIFEIFDKFKQVANTGAHYRGGAGLGLFIAKKIVEMHNGMIWVESKLHKGTIFRIQLPL